MSQLPECEHIAQLRQQVAERGISIYGEKTEEPSGWVNVHCHVCDKTFEVDPFDPSDKDDA